MMELRMSSALIWITLLLVLSPCVFRVVWKGGATALDKVLTVTFVLAANRICFNLVNQFTPGQQEAVAFCQVSGAMAGLAMCFVAHSALKAQSRG